MNKILPNWQTGDIKELKPFSNIKYILADLDGTIVSSRDEIVSETFRDLCNKLQYYKYHIKFSLATGRTFFGIKNILNQITIDENSPIILYNGSLVINKLGRVLFCNKIIPNDALLIILQLLLEFNISVFAYYFNTSDILEISNNNISEFVYGWSNIEKPALDFNKMIINWDMKNDLSDEYKLLAILIDISRAEKYKKEILSRLKNILSISITSSGNKYIEIKPYGNNKGVALSFVRKYLNLKKNEIATIGDNDNDIDMFKEAGISVTVDNASNNAKINSDYTCNYNVIGGVIQLLRLTKNAKRLFYKNRNIKENNNEP